MKLKFILIAGFLFATNSYSQTLSEKVQKRYPGAGTVVLHQDSYIRILLDGRDSEVTIKKNASPSVKKNENKIKKKEENKNAGIITKNNITVISDTKKESSEDLQYKKKVYKNSVSVNGYRIRIYSGGSSRDARQKAYSKGYLFKSVFMDIPVYTHFYSPHWMCSVGNFKTYGDAYKFLKELSSYQQFAGAVIVKSKIQVEQ